MHPKKNLYSIHTDIPDVPNSGKGCETRRGKFKKEITPRFKDSALGLKNGIEKPSPSGGGVGL